MHPPALFVTAGGGVGQQLVEKQLPARLSGKVHADAVLAPIGLGNVFWCKFCGAFSHHGKLPGAHLVQSCWPGCMGPGDCRGVHGVSSL